MATYTGTVPSGSLAAGAGLPAAWTQQVGLSLTALESSATPYTPTLTGFTPGNGTAAGRYIQVGKFVVFYASFTFGSTSAGAAATPTLSLPVSVVGANFGVITGQFIDSSAGNIYQALPYQVAVGTVSLYIPGTSGLYTVPTSTTPFGAAWATGDSIVVRGVIEAA